MCPMPSGNARASQHMDRLTDTQMERWRDRWTDIQRDIWMDGLTDIWTIQKLDKLVPEYIPVI